MFNYCGIIVESIIELTVYALDGLIYGLCLTRSIVVIWVKIFKTEKTIEIQLVRLTEVCGKVLSEKNAYKSVKTALLLSNVIDEDHQDKQRPFFITFVGFKWCSS